MSKKMTQHITLITFLIMLLMNVLSILLPINNIRIEDISKIYDNLFMPAAFTFSIWGFSYILLSVYIVFQYKSMTTTNEKIITEVNKRFSLS